MTYGATVDRVADPSLDLTSEERSTVNLLSENYMKWTYADEVTLGMVGMSSYCNKLGRKPMETFAGH